VNTEHVVGGMYGRGMQGWMDGWGKWWLSSFSCIQTIGYLLFRYCQDIGYLEIVKEYGAGEGGAIIL